MSEADNVKDIILRASIRLAEGELKYGEFNPKTDTRDLFTEAVEECLDCINYNIFMIRKLDRVRKRLRTEVQNPQHPMWVQKLLSDLLGADS